MKKSFSDMFSGLLKTAIDEVCNGSQREAARICGVDQSAVNRWLNGKTSPRLQDIAPLFDAAGVTLSKAGEESGFTVSFRAPKPINTENGDNDIEDQRFIAVPIVKDPQSLTPFYVPKANRLEWTIVSREFRSVHGRQNLIVVLINDDAMHPTFGAGDAVLVDRDFDEIENGRMYLVQTEDFTGIRRVFINEAGDDSLLILSADNPRYQPQAFLLQKQLGGDIRHCVLGRATWVRADIKKR